MVVLKNQTGGYYPWTIDELIRIDDSFFLIEKKHSAQKRLPSLNDIKDGYLKLIVFNNITKLTDVKGRSLSFKACLGLTSEVGRGAHSNMAESAFRKLNLDKKEAQKLQLAFEEGKINNIVVYYLGKDSRDLEEQILRCAKSF